MDKSEVPRRRWARSYPPLILLLVSILIAVIVLPSSLNLPQSNPTTVLEYAPIPPEDDEPPPPVEGNVSSLGLGQSGTLAAAAPPPPPPILEGLGGRPRQERCGGDPPRQTEDPSSPPCVPFFEGDNFGATYQGVDKDEIVVLVYFDRGSYGPVGQSEITPPAGSYIDIDKPALPPCPGTSQGPDTDPESCDHIMIRMLKAFSRYFNTRFQTYDRHVHYWAYIANSRTAAARRSDAVANWEKLKPFAVIDAATFQGFNQEYQTAMANLGVLTFSSTEAGLPNSFYREVAPQAWGFWPDLEHWAALYSSYVCQRIAPNPTAHYNGGIGAPNGEPRKFGMYYPVDPDEPGLERFSGLVLDSISKCGVTPIEATYENSGFAVDGNDTGTEATEAAATFESNDVTTVLYIGTETRFSNALDSIRYYPEIVVAGDLENDNNFVGQTQNQAAWSNAWAMTYHVRVGRLAESPGWRAYKEGYPEGDDNVGGFARDAYYDHFMLFTGIQVAGPKLTPESIDEGFHAIPEQRSPDPFVPAMFFDEGDFSAVKDGAEQWWDTTGRPPGSNNRGCWRMTNEGRRSIAGGWESGDQVFANPDDPCTGYGGSIRVAPPGS